MISGKLRIYGKPELKSLTDITSQLESTINSFSSFTGITVTYYDKNDNIKWYSNGTKSVCTNFDVFKEKKSACRRNLISATSIASAYSEPYIFLCRAGLVKIAFSLIIQGENCGCFIAGPFVMGEFKSSIYSNILALNSMDSETYSKAIMEINDLKVYTPKEVDNIALLMRSCILSSIAANNDYLANHENYEKTTSLNKKLQKSKQIDESLAYPHNLEDELANYIKAGDASNGISTINNLLNKISIIEAGELDSVKVAAIGIFSNLSRTAFSNGILSAEQMDDRFDEIEKINRASSFSDIAHLASMFIDGISKLYKKRHYSGDSSLIKETISIIFSHYNQKITLADISQKLHTNPSYLSTLFKKETNTKFIDFLNNHRVEKSIKLLTDTSLPLSEIAEETGFDDQGYFSKVFKRSTGLTPREYRKKYQSQGIRE